VDARRDPGASWRHFNDVGYFQPMARFSGRRSPLARALAAALSLAPICGLGWPLGASAAVKSFVQKRRAEISSGSSVRASFGMGNRGGDLIVAYAVWDGGGGVSVSDSRGNAYASAAGPTTAGDGVTQAQIFYAAGVQRGSNAVTASFENPVAAHGTLIVHEYSGLGRVAPLDVAAGAASASGSAAEVDSGALQTTSSGELLFAAISSDGSAIEVAAPFRARARTRGTLIADAFSGDAGPYDVTALQNGGSWVAQLVAFGYTGGQRNGPAYPVKPGASNRYLVDQNGKPFLITGDSPQSLVVNVTEAQAESLIADRARAGFNTLWIDLIVGTYTHGRADGSTLDGILPFTDGWFTTPNEAYFARVDREIRLCAKYGIQVLLDPLETGFFVVPDDAPLVEAGLDAATAYGRYVGARYRGFDNIIWLNGDDFQNWEDPNRDALAQAVANGIRSQDPAHIQTVELNAQVSGSLDDPSWAPIIQLNASYTAFPTYAQVLADYHRSNFVPTFLVESTYDFEYDVGSTSTNPPTSNPAILRREAYWALTSGATGQMYGNGFTWPFLPGWQQHLDTPGSHDMDLARKLFESKPWWELVPDDPPTLVTAGGGTFQSTCANVYVDCMAANDYVTATRAPDGSLAILYVPAGNAITVDLSRMGPRVKASWFDPSRGSFSALHETLSNTSTVFQPPGLNHDGATDWVLVLEAQPLP
jgi:hypothetical protein